jgi:hypothetical protein
MGASGTRRLSPQAPFLGLPWGSYGLVVNGWLMASLHSPLDLPASFGGYVSSCGYGGGASALTWLMGTLLVVEVLFCSTHSSGPAYRVDLSLGVHTGKDAV